MVYTTTSRPLHLSPIMAATTALLGVVMGMVSLGTGWLGLGVTGLLVMGIALGLTGGIRRRMLIACLLWLTATGLTLTSALLGEVGFTLIGPLLLSLVVFAIGQCAGLLAGVLVRQQT